MSLSDLAAKPVQTLAPYVPGKPLDELEREYGITNSIKLASNENPFGMGAQARAAIERTIAAVGLYPDGSGFELKAALSRKHGVAQECITLGNGSNDVLVMLAEAFLTPELEAVYSQYCFAVYPIVVQAAGALAREAKARPAHDAQPFGHDLDALHAQITPKTRLVFIANPNNPTGTWVEAQQLEQFVANVPQHALVVIDEAYIEYVTEPGSADASTWLSRYNNLVVTRTFSKAYGLAGLRIGYALSHPQVADMLNRVRQPFNVNSLALAAATAALEDIEHLRRSVAANTAGLSQVRTGVAALGLTCLPSRGNFVLVDTGRSGAAVYEGMLRQGVIVRPVAGYGLPQHLRITIGTEQENARMLSALERALQLR